jgi:hypothetical protein
MAQHIVQISPVTTVKVFELNPARIDSAESQTRLVVDPGDVILVDE